MGQEYESKHNELRNEYDRVGDHHDQAIERKKLEHQQEIIAIPFFVLAGTPWTLFLLALCWALTGLAIWHKLTHPAVKSKWSTSSYLGLGAIGLAALPDLTGTPLATLWCILAGSLAYVIGTVFYTRRTLPYRYAIWHGWVNVGAIAMLTGLWLAVF